MDWGVFVGVIGAIGTFFGGVAAIIIIGERWFSPPWKRWRLREIERRKQQDAMTQLALAQLSTNGGGSLLDKVNKIDEMRRTMDANNEEAKGRWDTIEEKLDGLSTRVGELEAEQLPLRPQRDLLREQLPKAGQLLEDLRNRVVYLEEKGRTKDD